MLTCAGEEDAEERRGSGCTEERGPDVAAAQLPVHCALLHVLHAEARQVLTVK